MDPDKENYSLEEIRATVPVPVEEIDEAPIDIHPISEEEALQNIMELLQLTREEAEKWVAENRRN